MKISTVKKNNDKNFMIILIKCQSYLEFFAELRGGECQKEGQAGADRKGDDLSQKGLVVSCFAAHASAKADFINPMVFKGLGIERVFRPADTF